MKRKVNKILGLALGERSMLVCEAVAGADGATQITRSAAFVYPADVLPSKPEAFGKALHAFLSSEGFTARAAVVGIPAKWTVTKIKQVPPIDPTLLPDMLRIQAESEFSAELKDLVHDYCGTSDVAAASPVMLVAMQRKHITEIESAAEAAGLNLLAITSTALALGSSGAGDRLTVTLSPSAIELTAWKNGQPSLVRHIAAGGALSPAVVADIRRSAMSAGAAASVAYYDDSSADAEQRQIVASAFATIAQPAPVAAGGFASASALATPLLNGQPLPVDFLNSRLAPPKKAALPREAIFGIAAGIILVIGIIFAWVDLHNKRKDLDDKNFTHFQLEPGAKNAAQEVAMIKYAQGWHTGKPRFLACLRDLTNAVPDNDRMYLTNFTLHDTMKGEIAGKAIAETEKAVRDTEKSVRALSDHLKTMTGGKRFMEVNLTFDSRKVRQGKEISFSVSFKYVPAD